MSDFALGFVLGMFGGCGSVALFLLVADWLCGIWIRRRANPPQQPQVDARRGFYSSTGGTTMKLYRDLAKKETLQAGDERFRHGNDWTVVAAELYGLTPSDLPWGLFRRPVDLPVLQPVTPEAIAELERREAWVILFRHKESKHCRYCVVKWHAVSSRWWGTPAGEENPLDWQWYIEPSAIPEVQQ